MKVVVVAPSQTLGAHWIQKNAEAFKFQERDSLIPEGPVDLMGLTEYRVIYLPRWWQHPNASAINYEINLAIRRPGCTVTEERVR